MSPSVIYFITTIVITISSIFMISIDGLYIKRTIVNMPISLVTSCVCEFNSTENINPYFDLDVLYEKLDNYLNKVLSSRCSYYTFSLFPYIIDNQNGYKEYFFDEDNLNRNVKIDFKATYAAFINFSCSFRYEINDFGGVNKI